MSADHTAAFVVTVLKTTREWEGLDAAMEAARAMIISASAILGHERGPIELGQVFDQACEAQFDFGLVSELMV